MIHNYDPLIGLLLLLTSGHVTFESIDSGSYIYCKTYSEEKCSLWVIKLGKNLNNEYQPHRSVIVHELAHAYDGLDDGIINGSPGHFTNNISILHTGTPYEKYCFSSKIEHYACEVVRTGLLK